MGKYNFGSYLYHNSATGHFSLRTETDKFLKHRQTSSPQPGVISQNKNTNLNKSLSLQYVSLVLVTLLLRWREVNLWISAKQSRTTWCLHTRVPTHNQYENLRFIFTSLLKCSIWSAFISASFFSCSISKDLPSRVDLRRVLSRTQLSLLLLRDTFSSSSFSLSYNFTKTQKWNIGIQNVPFQCYAWNSSATWKSTL